MKADIVPSDIEWVGPDAPPRSRRCTICAHPGPHALRLEVPSLAAPHQTLVLLNCSACGGLFFDPPGITDFSDLNQRREDFWRFYAEVGGGVWETIWPLLVARRAPGATLLDVGCGFGFAVDFWRRTFGSEAIGIELADYGRVGAQLLRVPIYAEYLQDCAELAGRRFDFVYASEVIEHVPDPKAFVELLAEHVSAAGVVVLTTPAAGFIEPKNESPTLLAALAPGFHGFLLSAQTLAALARGAGFEHVEARAFGERQILWASRSPLALDFALDAPRDTYLAYLRNWLAVEDHDTPVWHGYAYRYVRDMVNAGRLAEAAPVASDLVAALDRRYPASIVDEKRMVDRAGASTTLLEFGREAPYFLPNLYYALAVLSEGLDRDFERAARYYGATETIALAASRLGSAVFLEATSLIWPARAALMRLAFQRGDIERAATIASQMARRRPRPDAQSGFVKADRAIVETYVPRACEELARRSAWTRARTLFDDYSAYLAGTYEAADLSDAGIVATLLGAQGPACAPEDPVFPLFFRALLEAQASGSTMAQSPAYRSLAALREAEIPDPAHRQRIDAYLRAADVLSPSKRYIFSYEVSFSAKTGPA